MTRTRIAPEPEAIPAIAPLPTGMDFEDRGGELGAAVMVTVAAVGEGDMVVGKGEDGEEEEELFRVTVSGSVEI